MKDEEMEYELTQDELDALDAIRLRIGMDQLVLFVVKEDCLDSFAIADDDFYECGDERLRVAFMMLKELLRTVVAAGCAETDEGRQRINKAIKTGLDWGLAEKGIDPEMEALAFLLNRRGPSA